MMSNQITFVRKFFLLLLSPLMVTIYALQRGSDYNYDFVNIKGQLAWSILHKRLGVDSQIGGRYSFAPFHDVWNVLLLGTGNWWLPVVFWSLVHSLIVVISYFIIRELVPTMNIYLQQIMALTSVTSPIILMQLGTGFGHLATSVFIGISLLFLIQGTKSGTYIHWLFAGAHLGIAFLLRSSNIPTIPAYLLAVSIIAVNSKQLVSFVLGFSYVYFGISIPWAWYSSNAAGFPFTGIAVVPKGVIGVCVVVAILCISPILLSSTNRYALKILSILDTKIALLSVRIGLVALVAYMVRKIYIIAQTGDPRFLITNLEMAKHRLVHTGSLVDNCCPVDLEVSYFDLRVQIATVIFVIAVGVFIYRRSTEAVRVVGVVTFVVLPVFMAVSYSGYIRYGSQALPYVPVSLAAIFGMKSRSSGFARAFLISGVLLLTFPVIPGLPFVKDVPRYAQLSDSQNLFSTDELLLANKLLPAKSVVFIGGPLASLLAQQLNRQDLVWTWTQPTASEIQNRQGDYFVLYNPMEPFTATRASETGVSTSECGVLRFQRLPLTICQLKSL
jgi:hypothetical protein